MVALINHLLTHLLTYLLILFFSGFVSISSKRKTFSLFDASCLIHCIFRKPKQIQHILKQKQ